MKDPASHIRSLAMVASTVTVNPHIPIGRYFRSGSEMLKMAKMYLDEGELENAFILYTKYTTLFVEQIPKHPEYPTLPDKDKFETRKKLETIFNAAEKVKAAVIASYTKKYEKWKEEQDKILAEEQLRLREVEELKLKAEKLRDEFEKEKSWRIAHGRELLKVSVADPPLQPPPEPLSPHPLPVINTGNLPSVDRSTKPRIVSSPDSDSESIRGLRIVKVPSKGIETFLDIARKNTESNIETCGILTGKMSHNQLVVTHLIIPKQTGTADSCFTDNEEDVFLYQDKYDLITIGWIHTHPSQTAFMSSVDLHTHCSYQLMMPEAIAIVCAPKYQSTCIFSLTQSYGLDYITQCRQKGFHPHPNESAIYEECAHVKLEDQTFLTVVDLRK